jgi:hypothetical protein
MDRKNRFSLPAFTATLALASVASFAATPLPKEGAVDVIACWSGVGTDINFSKEYTATSFEMTGTLISKVPGGLGDGSSFRCVGMNTTIKGKPGGSNVCEVLDSDGDKRLNYFTLSEGKVLRESLTGTVKY